MSHISKYGQKIKDIDAFIRVLDKKGYKWRSGNVIVKQFGRNEVEAAFGFEIPGWRYELAVTDEGEILYDHWGSGSGTMGLLGKTIQDYNEVVIFDKALISADICYVEKLENGDRKIIMEWN